jgi:hypothetical protein
MFSIAKICNSRVLLVVMMLSALPCVAQNWSDWSGPKGAARLRARVLDQDLNAKQHAAVVEVEVQNVFLHHPDFVEQSGVQEGILKYELDQCPAILTTDTRMTFQQLPSGSHEIAVGLLGGDNRALAPKVKLQVSVP